jgi:hypothetical protein
MRQHPTPLRPDRIRAIEHERPFGWITLRVVTSGLLGQLSPAAKLVYFFLCLVADRQGVSFYGPKRIILGLEPAQLSAAVAELRAEDVVAFDGTVYQVLSLPSWLGKEYEGEAGQVAKSARESAPAPQQQRRGGPLQRGPQHVSHLLGELLKEG